jgi:lia operon protein LiaG
MLGFKKTEEFYWDKTVQGNEITMLNIDTSSTEVIISSGENEDIEMELKGEISSKLKENVQVEVKQSGCSLNVMVIVERNSSFSFGMDVIKLALSLEVPQKLYEKIIVKTSSGGINAKDLEGKEVKFKASSGEVDASGIKAHTEFKSKAKSGGIQLNGIEAPAIFAKANSGTLILQNLISEDIQAKASSGRIIAKKWTGNFLAETNSGVIDLHTPELTGKIDAEASSGDVMLFFDKKPESFTIDFSGSSGEANVELKGIEFEEKSDHRISGKMGDGKYTIRVKTSSGDFDFRSK